MVPNYVGADTPWGQSGKTGDAKTWEEARRPIVDALERDGTFLDVGCANGYLLETVSAWAAEKGVEIEPYGVDIAPELVEIARLVSPSGPTGSGSATPSSGIRPGVSTTCTSAISAACHRTAAESSSTTSSATSARPDGHPRDVQRGDRGAVDRSRRCRWGTGSRDASRCRTGIHASCAGRSGSTREPRPHAERSLNRIALSATLHCLTGCAIGEILGLAIGTALGWGNLATIVLAVVLAFSSATRSRRAAARAPGSPFGQAAGIALASDTVSIVVMEIVDNAIVLLIPGAMDAGLDELLFWGSLAFALLVAFVAAFPVNRWLIARGRGHAVAHAHH